MRSVHNFLIGVHNWSCLRLSGLTQVAIDFAPDASRGFLDAALPPNCDWLWIGWMSVFVWGCRFCRFCERNLLERLTDRHRSAIAGKKFRYVLRKFENFIIKEYFIFPFKSKKKVTRFTYKLWRLLPQCFQSKKARIIFEKKNFSELL